MLLLIMLAYLRFKHILDHRLVVELFRRLLHDLFLFNDQVVAVTIAVISIVVAATRVIPMVVLMLIFIMVVVIFMDMIHTMKLVLV